MNISFKYTLVTNKNSKHLWILVSFSNQPLTDNVVDRRPLIDVIGHFTHFEKDNQTQTISGGEACHAIPVQTEVSCCLTSMKSKLIYGKRMSVFANSCITSRLIVQRLAAYAEKTRCWTIIQTNRDQFRQPPYQMTVLSAAAQEKISRAFMHAKQCPFS